VGEEGERGPGFFLIWSSGKEKGRGRETINLLSSRRRREGERGEKEGGLKELPSPSSSFIGKKIMHGHETSSLSFTSTLATRGAHRGRGKKKKKKKGGSVRYISQNYAEKMGRASSSLRSGANLGEKKKKKRVKSKTNHDKGEDFQPPIILPWRQGGGKKKGRAGPGKEKSVVLSPFGGEKKKKRGGSRSPSSSPCGIRPAVRILAENGSPITVSGKERCS